MVLITEHKLRSIIRKSLLEATADFADVDDTDGNYRYRVSQGGNISIIKSPNNPAISARNPRKVRVGSKAYGAVARMIKDTNRDAYDKYIKPALSSVSKPRSKSAGSEKPSEVVWFRKAADDLARFPYPPGQEARILKEKDPVPVFKCTSGKFTGCAAYVGTFIGEGIGQAWHAYNRTPLSLGQKMNAYDQMTESDREEAVKIFTDINRAHNPSSFNSAAFELSKKFVPDQSSLGSMLELGDVVGLFHYSSKFHAYALFETLSGKILERLQVPGAYPPVVSAGNGLWSPELYGKDVNFKPTQDFIRGRINPTYNTHVGVVGAKVNGVPIIFHYIGDERLIYATPLTQMKAAPGRDAIVWIASKGEDPTPVVNIPEPIDDRNPLEVAVDYWSEPLGVAADYWKKAFGIE